MIDWTKVLQGAGQFGQVAGAAAGGAAKGRADEANINRGGAGVDLARKKFLNAAPSLFAGQGLTADLIKNAGDFKLNIPGINSGTSTGGLRPSTLGAGAQDAASSLAASAKARMAELPTNIGSGPGGYFSNSPDLMPQPSGMDKFLGAAGKIGSLAGTGSQIAKGLGLLGGTAAAGGAAAGGGLGGTSLLTMAPSGLFTAGGGGAATAGTAGGIGALGATTLGVGAAAALIAIAIKKHQNATKGDRNAFAKDAGFPDIAAFNEYLSTLGPAGQAARNYGENVVGKHNKQQEAQWMQMVQDAVGQSGQPLTMGQRPKFGIGGR